MTMKDAINILPVNDFQQRLRVAITRTAIAVMNEVANEVQTLSVTGTPTGGTFTLASLPGAATLVMTGTLTSAATTCTGLISTVGLFVGMAVTGTNVAAGTTVAAIVSGTAVTLSANASGSGAQTLTFSGTPLAVVPYNADAPSVQAILQALGNIGVGNVVCTGGPLPGTPVVITFANTLGSAPQKLITIGTNSLTGGSSPTPSMARTTAGANKPSHTARAALAQRVLSKLDDWCLIMGLGVTDNATIQTDYPASNQYLLNVSESTVDNDIAFQVSAIWNAYLQP